MSSLPMQPLSASELLRVWEQSLGLSGTERALLLLQTACNLPDTEAAASWSIGRRDARLFQLRGWMFGQRFVNLADCPQCGERVEWEMSLSDFSSRFPDLQDDPTALRMTKDSYEITFRLPNSRDLLEAVNRQLDEKSLLINCIQEVKNDQQIVPAVDLPDPLLDHLSGEMEAADPFSHLVIEMHCPECRHQWESVFDIVRYLWTEIDAWAGRILQEVYTLARAFGWAEKDILEMSPRRRQIYLKMVGA